MKINLKSLLKEVKHIDIAFTERGRYYKAKFDGKKVDKSEVEDILSNLLGSEFDLSIADDDKLDKAIKDLKKQKVKLTWNDNIDVS